MTETMGQIIRRLRKERNLTQEELAEVLNISSPAVSKWESDTSMPDISQVVPLANVFGVSTDVLFGVAGTNADSEAWKIIKNAQSLLTNPLDTSGLRKEYAALQEGLKLYPSNTILLMQSLETGIALAYPENDVYDAENGRNIYHECVRQANTVISYSKNTTDVLRAHMIMVLLHAAYGNNEQAMLHAENFPWRADMTIHMMYAYCTHWQKDYEMEAANWQYDIMYQMEAALNTLVNLSSAYSKLGKLDDAITTLEGALKLIRVIFEQETVVPPVHYREDGDIYLLLADICLKKGDGDRALSYLESMAAYDIDECAKFTDDTKVTTPLLRDVKHRFYKLYLSRSSNLKAKLNDERLASLRNDERFVRLLERANAMAE